MVGVSLILLLIMYMLLGLAGVLILILALPVELRVRTQPSLVLTDDWEASGALPWQATVRWGWGMVSANLQGDRTTIAQKSLVLAGIRLGIGGKNGPAKGEPARAKASKEQPPTERPTKKSKARKRWRVDVATIFSLIYEGRRLVRRVWRLLGIRISGDLSYGFPDPALTGLTLGLFHAGLKPPGLRLVPEFFDPCVRGRVEAVVRLTGLKVLAAALAFALSAPVRRLWMPKFRFGALHLKVR